MHMPYEFNNKTIFFIQLKHEKQFDITSFFILSTTDTTISCATRSKYDDLCLKNIKTSTNWQVKMLLIG